MTIIQKQDLEFKYIQDHVRIPVSSEFRKMLRLLGYRKEDLFSWAPYIYDVSKRYSVPVHVAVKAFHMVGEQHAFDMFVMVLLEYVNQAKALRAHV